MTDATRFWAGACAFAATAFLSAGGVSAQEGPRWSLAIHGGAGVIERDSLTPEQDGAYREALARALQAGEQVLAGGGSALDAVTIAVQVLEDDPLFNAGRGAVFTAAGVNELDAAIMDGESLQAGAVAGVTRTRHPVRLARAVMDVSPHVMLIGEGADAFAAEVGLEQVEPAFFFTERRWRGLEATLRGRGDAIPPRPDGAPGPEGADLGPIQGQGRDENRFGTVGAVALDQQGRLAAATSTGGMTAKRWGRVGDVPVIGAGTYASNADGCAVSATGSGEYFIRATVARDICARMGAGMGARMAGQAEIDEVGALGGDGGVIVMGSDGASAFAMNTSGMYRARVAWNRAAEIAIYADEESE